MASRIRWAARLAVVALVAATAGLVLPGGPAQAASCPGAHGVTVVVDFHGLGGGVQTSCVANGGGKTASSLFPSAGFPLTYVQRQPGFVCRVSGKPSSDPCVNTPPADAYWGLWWSNGTSGSWSYATAGAGSQRIPDGGSVAFSWNGSSSRSVPGAAPPKHQAQPSSSPKPSTKPTTKPSTKPTTQPSSRPTQHAPSATASADPSTTSSAVPGEAGSSKAAKASKASKAGKASKNASATPSGAAGEPTKSPGGTGGEMLPADPAPSADAPQPDDGGLPSWVGPAVVAVLFAAGATVAVVRRRRSSG